MKRVLTIYEVRRDIKTIFDTLEIVNCHIIDKSLDTYDYDNLRKAYDICRNIIASNWTTQIL